MLQRKLFFLFEKLQIRAAERYAITTLIVLAILIRGSILVLPEKNPYDHEFYAPLMEEFHRRSLEKSREDSLILARYYPAQSPSVVQVAEPVSLADSPRVRQPRVPDPDKSLQPGGININTANITELSRLPGIGPSIAQRIIDYRTTNGPYNQTDELLRVIGIGPSRLNQILPFIRLDGPDE